MKKYFLTGLLVWLPIVLIYFIGHFLFRWVDPLLLKLPSQYRPDHWIGFHIPLIEWLFTFFVVALTGFLVSNYLGRKLLQLWTKLVESIPLIGRLFHGTKKFLNILFQQEQSDIGNLVLVEYPRKGIWRIGFQMSKPFNWAIKDRTTVAVAFLTCPEPTSGYLAITPVDEIVDLKMSMTEGLKTIFSFGIIQPQKQNGLQDTNKSH